MSNNLLSSLTPPLEEVTAWQKGKETQLGAVVEAIKNYHGLIMKNPDSFVESDEYFFCQRTINLLTWYKDKSVFQEVLEIHEIFSLNDFDDFMSGVCSKYLEACVSRANFSDIYKRWKKADKDSFHFCDLFTLLIKADPQNQELIAFSKWALWEDNLILKSDIAEHVADEIIFKEIRRRLRYIAPMVKYLSPHRRENPYLDEMIELGSSYYERSEGVKSPEIGSLSPEDDFIIDILGHTDERSVNLIHERVNRYEENKAEFLKFRDQREAYFEREFMAGLPASMDEWQQSLGVSQQQREEFYDAGFKQGYLGQVEEAPTTKIGRNDPCPCGSGKKFKKCCL